MCEKGATERTFIKKRAKLIGFLSNNKKALKKFFKDNDKILKKDAKIYGFVLGIAIIVLAFLNFLWWLFAIIGCGFFSPLNHQEGLQMVVDVICAVVVSVATVRLEYRWRKQDGVEAKLKAKQHEQEIISDRIRELNLNDVRAVGYAVTDIGNFLDDFPHHYDAEMASANFAVAVVAADTHKTLIPAHFKIDGKSTKIKDLTICGFHFDDDFIEQNVKHCLYHDALLLWIEPVEDDKVKRAISEYLSSALYMRQRREAKTFQFSLTVSLQDFSIINEKAADEKAADEKATGEKATGEKAARFSYEILLSLHPISPFTDCGTFECQVIRSI